jgi:hypothetical protein
MLRNIYKPLLLSTISYGVENTKFLGRCKIEYDYKNTYIKTDYANNEHCGVCLYFTMRNQQILDIDEMNYSMYLIKLVKDFLK